MMDVTLTIAKNGWVGELDFFVLVFAVKEKKSEKKSLYTI